MNVIARPPLPLGMTREEFLDWAARQQEDYEFDGTKPVPMTSGNRNHSLITSNLIIALGVRLRGTPYFPSSPEGPGLSPWSRAVRYPDVTVAPRAGKGTDRIFDDALIAFEVVSPSSAKLDRQVKLREYLAVPSLRRYVILESEFASAGVFARSKGDEGWTASAVAMGEALALPEIGLEIPMAEIYEDCDIPAEEPRNPDATT
jgi:Uma2 family endonuclease